MDEFVLANGLPISYVYYMQSLRPAQMRAHDWGGVLRGCYGFEGELCKSAAHTVFCAGRIDQPAIGIGSSFFGASGSVFAGLQRQDPL